MYEIHSPLHLFHQIFFTYNYLFRYPNYESPRQQFLKQELTKESKHQD